MKLPSTDCFPIDISQNALNAVGVRINYVFANAFSGEDKQYLRLVLCASTLKLLVGLFR